MQHVQYLIFMYEQDVVTYARKSQGSASMGISSLVAEACCRGEEPAFMPRGFGLNERQPPTRGEFLKEVVSRVRGVGYNFTCLALGSRRPTGPEEVVDCSQ